VPNLPLKISLRFLTTTYVQTYRLPSPLLIYQLALMPGSFLVGFLLSPILYLSRYISQKPSHRLRFPEEKNRHRRFLALGFYLGTLLIVGGLIGFWSKWQLDWRDPWVWIVLWVLEGSHWWSRPVLLAYWAVLASISVTGWELQLAKTRHKRPWTTVGPPGRDAGSSSGPTAGKSSTSRSAASSSVRIGSGPSSQPASAREGGHATGTYHPTAVMARVPVLSLNGRRKFFHGLALLMFVPGIYFDVRLPSARSP
jgi:dolichol kinase